MLSYPPERVALLRGLRVRLKGRIIWCIRDTVEVPNVHDTPEGFFAIPLACTPVDTVGVIHSHPDDEPHPSIDDFDGLPRGWIGAVMYGGELSWYTKNRPVSPSILACGGEI